MGMQGRIHCPRVATLCDLATLPALLHASGGRNGSAEPAHTPLKASPAKHSGLTVHADPGGAFANFQMPPGGASRWHWLHAGKQARSLLPAIACSSVCSVHALLQACNSTW